MLMPAAGASDGDSAKKRSRRSASERDCIAEGGRYDDLVMRFRRPGDRTPLPVACGVRFAVGKIASSTLVAAKVSAGPQNLSFPLSPNSHRSARAAWRRQWCQLMCWYAPRAQALTRCCSSACRLQESCGRVRSR